MAKTMHPWVRTMQRNAQEHARREAAVPRFRATISETANGGWALELESGASGCTVYSRASAAAGWAQVYRDQDQELTGVRARLELTWKPISRVGRQQASMASRGVR